MGLISIIANNNYGLYNKEIAKKIGLNEAILLGELASEYDYYLKNNMLEDEWFFSTVDNIEEQTTLTDYQQRKALDKLKEYNIIETKVKGIPAKRYIKINEEQVFKLFDIQFSKNLKTSSQKTKELYNSNNNNINNKSNNKKEIYKENISKEVIDRLNELTNSNFKHKTKNTQELINGRLNEGYSKEDLMMVVEKMCYLWGNPKKGEKDMREYLRPSTLFRSTNFENYYNKPVKEKEITIMNSDIDISDF